MNKSEENSKDNLISTINVNEDQEDKTLSKEHNYDINTKEINTSVNTYKQTELATLNNSSSNINQEESLYEKDNNNILIKEEENALINTMYGNSINEINPKRIGNLQILFYDSDDKPLIILGTKCKKCIYNL